MSTATMISTNAYELQDTLHEPYTILRSPDHIQRPAPPRASREHQFSRPRSLQVSAESHHEASLDHAHLTTSAQPATAPSPPLKPFRANLIILQVSFVNFLTSMSTGIVVVGLPSIAKHLALPEQLYLWPSSVFGLTTGSTLLLAGAIADVVGPRTVDLLGCFVAGIFTLACGLSQKGIQLVVFRALQGIGMAMHFPCSVSLVSKFVPSGKRRNIGFACLGLSMPLGYSVGLVLGGVLINTIGWRVGFYIPGVIMLAQTVIAVRLIPADAKTQDVWSKLVNDVDWVGAMIACVSLAMFSYVLAIISADSNSMRQPFVIALLVISVLLMLLFPVWMRRQEKCGRPALIPNSLWRNMSFTTVCIMTVLIWGVQNSMELFSSLYFQEVQDYSPFEASLRLLPSLIVGVILNLSTGYFVDRASPFWLILISSLLTAGSPLLMALIKPAWPYWWGAFPAQVLAPLSGDIFFTVGLIIVSEVFPERTQALAGAVFNTVAFFGWSFGINIMQVVSMLVTEGTSYRDKSSPPALLLGYQASFWAMFAAMLASALIGIIGLRNVSKIGLKRE